MPTITLSLDERAGAGLYATIEPPAGQQGVSATSIASVRLALDTGSERTHILKSILKGLGLVGRDGVIVETYAGPQHSPEYDLILTISGLNLRLPVVAAEMEREVLGFQGTLGRDVLNRCEMHYDGPAKRVTLTYQGDSSANT